MVHSIASNEMEKYREYLVNLKGGSDSLFEPVFLVFSYTHLRILSKNLTTADNLAVRSRGKLATMHHPKASRTLQPFFCFYVHT
jgi:hypothetical protein